MGSAAPPALLSVGVHPANVPDGPDGRGARKVLWQMGEGRFPRMQRLWADGAYAGIWFSGRN